MDRIISADPEERAEIFRKVSEAGKSELSPDVIEKDFWVCRVLYGLFHEMTLRYPLVFKGGTSLSKAFQIIDRFSEDVDLTLELTGESPFLSPLEEGISRSEADRRIGSLVAEGEVIVKDIFLGNLRSCAGEQIGKKGWTIASDDKDSMTVLFAYPEGVTRPLGGYLRPVIRLEFGVRGETWPSGNRMVSPITAEHFPELCGEYASFNVRTLDAERTFWEKATILHAEHHRPGSGVIRERLARHYYDLYMLSEHPAGKRALLRPDLLRQVVAHKSVLFRSGWAQYESAKPGTFSLLPDSGKLGALKRDYFLMRSMFTREPPSWEEITEGLRALERKINYTG